MADVPGKFFSATKVRTGVSPSSPGSLVGEPLPPVNPPGTSLNSVGLTMPSAFTVSNSPLTSNGTIGVAGAGTVGQYIRGDGSLADFPESSGGGSSVSYYLNGSVNQGTIGGVAYKELNKVPILGAGTDFTINANGYIASFITDAGDPNLLEIPAGNWNFETYFSASSSGGTPSFYVELYKYDGSTFTLIASSSSTPEFIAFGTITTPYFSSLAVPTTTLALTDRLAVRYYVTHSGRTITLHTENNHLCQIITTFTTGLTALNGLTAQIQNFAVGTSGTDFAIASATATHTFNLPTASATNRGALSSADWTTFNGKQNALTNPVTGTGTTNYLPKFTSTGSTIGNSNIQDSGTIVSVGVTSTFSSIVNVGGDIQFTSSVGILKTNANNSSLVLITNPSVVDNEVRIEMFGRAYFSEANTIFYRGATQIFTSSIAGTEYMRISSAGRLLINKTNDEGFRLDVSGTVRFSDALTGTSAIFSSSVTASSFIKTGGTSSQFLKADGSVDSTTYVPTTRTITINGTSQDLSANRTYNVGTVTSVTATAGTGISISGSPITSSGTLTITNTSPDQVVSLTASTGISISGTYPNFTITNTSPSSGGTVTSVTASSPLFSSGGNTPNITIQQASGSQSGFLSSTDWTTFNSKVSSQWVTNGSNIYYNTGIVIVGNTTNVGDGPLQVSGTATTYASFNSTNAGGSFISWARSGVSIGGIGNSGNMGVGILDDLEVRSGIGKGLHLKTDGGKLTLATGGAVTLDGALNGTSASFSSSVAAKSSITVSNNGGENPILSVVSAFADGYRATLRLWNQHTGGKAWEVYSTNDADGVYGGGKLAFVNSTNSVNAMILTSGGNVLIGTTTNGSSKLKINGLPTSSSGLASGDVWNDGGTLKIK